MAYDIAADIRLDPRLKALLGAMAMEGAGDVDSRETLLAEANSEEAKQQAELFRGFMDMCDTEEAAPSAGLRVHTEKIVSEPDGNTINLQVIRPDTDETVPCVYYIHGGGMASLSCYDGMYRGWGKIIAANGVAVVMVDFRNCGYCLVGARGGSVPGRAQRLRLGPEVGGGQRRAPEHRPGPDHRRGRERRREPDPGNWPQAQARRGARPHQGPVRAVPVHRGASGRRRSARPRPRTTGSCSTCTTTAAPLATGSRRSRERNPLAWPSFATAEDVAGFPPTVISVNECDPLRDEGINFYRLLLAAGVPARGRQVMGTSHGTEIFTIACPDISRDTARDIAAFCRG